MKISYAITVCNEFVEIQKLVNFVRQNKRQQDEIIVLFDQKNGTEEIASWLTKQSKYPNFQFWRGLDFNGHFANWKNQLKSYCSGDYIFQIDADELPNKALIENLPTILESNPDNEVYLVPRSYAALPAQEELALYHPKDIKKQEKQNKFYDSL